MVGLTRPTEFVQNIKISSDMLSMVEGVAMDSTMDLDDSRVQNLGQRVTKDRRRDFSEFKSSEVHP